MLVSLLRYLQGYLRVRVTGYSPERFLNLCKHKKILVWELMSVSNAYEMYMKVSDFRKLKPILKKTGTKITITERLGLPFFFHQYRKRNLFFIGLGFCFLLVYSLTFFIWDIDIQGNLAITDDTLLRFLETEDVKHGMAKQQVDCQRIVTNIRKEFDEIIWVSVSLEGTRLFVHVKENTDTFALEDARTEPADIIADKSGIVTSMITRQGVPQVQVGDEVTEGALLVSGTVPVLNDAGEEVTRHYVAADADIILETIYYYEDDCKKEYQEKTYTGKRRARAIVTLGSYAVEMGRSKNKFANTETHTEETQVKIGSNFYLPIHLGTKEIFEYDWTKKEYSREKMEQILTERFHIFCEDLKEEQVKILDGTLNITYHAKGAHAASTLTLQEVVGIKRKIVDFQQVPMVE